MISGGFPDNSSASNTPTGLWTSIATGKLFDIGAEGTLAIPLFDNRSEFEIVNLNIMAKKGGKKDSAIKDDESRKRVEAEARSLNLVQYEVIQEKRQSELSNSKLNGLKIQTRWRDLMRLGIPRSNVVAKSVDLKKQIEVLAQIQARRLDRKLAALSNLKINLSEAEEQYNSALQHHIMNVNLLNNIQSSRLETLKAQYQSDLTILEGDFGGERLYFGNVDSRFMLTRPERGPIFWESWLGQSIPSRKQKPTLNMIIQVCEMMLRTRQSTC